MSGKPQNSIEKWAVMDYIADLRMGRRLCVGPKMSAKRNWKQLATHLRLAGDCLNRRLGTMARNVKSGKDFQFEGWVNVRLEEEHKAEIAHLAQNTNPDGLIDWLAAMAFDGYSFSASWDDYSDALQVSLVCKDADDPNYGLGLSSRHPDFDMAVLSLQYKHEQILDGNWTEAPPTPRGSAWS
jgi:hypothetical protein